MKKDIPGITSCSPPKGNAARHICRVGAGTTSLFYRPPENAKSRISFPPLPPERWCDLRKEYEGGMTLKAIAEKHYCDPRTVRRLIMQNRNSAEIGKQTAPTRLSFYAGRIEELLQEAQAYVQNAAYAPDAPATPHAQDSLSLPGKPNEAHAPNEQYNEDEANVADELYVQDDASAPVSDPTHGLHGSHDSNSPQAALSGRINGICALSRWITTKLAEEGYTGSERTVRNYLQSRIHVIHSRKGHPGKNLRSSHAEI